MDLMYRGVLTAFIMLVAISTTGGNNSLVVASDYGSDVDREVIGYTVYNGKLVRVVKTTKTTYHILKK